MAAFRYHGFQAGATPHGADGATPDNDLGLSGTLGDSGEGRNYSPGNGSRWSAPISLVGWLWGGAMDRGCPLNGGPYLATIRPARLSVGYMTRTAASVVGLTVGARLERPEFFRARPLLLQPRGCLLSTRIPTWPDWGLRSRGSSGRLATAAEARDPFCYAPAHIRRRR